mgnify:FL=1
MRFIFKIVKKLLVTIFILIIRFYQILISPLLGSNCRFLPTCSEYTIESIKAYGLIKGISISLKRISSCHPFGKKGFDPIVKENKKN